MRSMATFILLLKEEMASASVNNCKWNKHGRHVTC